MLQKRITGLEHQAINIFKWHISIFIPLMAYKSLHSEHFTQAAADEKHISRGRLREGEMGKRILFVKWGTKKKNISSKNTQKFLKKQGVVL